VLECTAVEVEAVCVGTHSQVAAVPTVIANWPVNQCA
jgi:hypothetical protein